MVPARNPLRKKKSFHVCFKLNIPENVSICATREHLHKKILTDFFVGGHRVARWFIFKPKNSNFGKIWGASE
jgi:hypothetical protein